MITLALWGGFAVLLVIGSPMVATYPRLFATCVVVWALIYFAVMAWLMWNTWQRRRRLIAALHTEMPPQTQSRPAWEYRSRAQLLSWPLIHIRLGGGLPVQRTPVKAWIAVGDCAYGRLFAFGGLTVAPISMGGCALGLIAFGGFGVGLLTMGGFGIGCWTFAGLGIGWQAYGGCVIGAQAALGGIAVAHQFALGALACAAEANNRLALAFMKEQPFFRAVHVAMQYWVLLHLLWVVPVLYWWRLIVRDKRRRALA